MPSFSDPTPPWLKPENRSVFDSPVTRGLQWAGDFFGANDPATSVMGIGSPMAVMGEGRGAVPAIRKMWDFMDAGQHPEKAAINASWPGTRSGATYDALTGLQDAGTQARRGISNRLGITDEAGRSIAPLEGNTPNPFPPRIDPSPYATFHNHMPGLPGEDAIPQFNVTGGASHGSTLSSRALAQQGIPIRGGIPPFNEAAELAARDAAMARLKAR